MTRVEKIIHRVKKAAMKNQPEDWEPYITINTTLYTHIEGVNYAGGFSWFDKDTELKYNYQTPYILHTLKEVETALMEVVNEQKWKEV